MVPGTLRRRLVTIPTMLVAALLTAAVAPVTLPIALLVDLGSRGKLAATRTNLLFLAFCLAEVIGLAAVVWIWIRHRDRASFIAANHRTQRAWALTLFRAATRIFSVRVEVEGGQQLAAPGACLIYLRHASTLDTLLPFALDLRHATGHERTFRYVLKHELLSDPCLDIVGNRLPNCFVRRGSDHHHREVERVLRLADDLGPREAVVIFPEGTRFTIQKRERGRARRDELSTQLTHTLSPLRAGALALGCYADELDVVIIAHAGLEAAGTLGDLLFGGLTRATLRIRVWRVPARDVPRRGAEFRAWLGERWLEVDAFVASAGSNAPEDREARLNRGRCD
jgi:1-acyl-sn-glycerol-3-phosphate acyltransferase